MTSTASTTTPTSVADLISKVMDKFDTDKDKKLSSTEFSSFLSSVLDGTQNLSASSAASTPVPQKGVSTGAYRSMLAGFDFQKLENPDGPGGGTIKYTAARIFQNYKPMPESLPAIIDELRAQGINAVQLGKDKIDFGDGYGPIDVIQGAYPGGGVAWQWLRE